MQLVTVEAILVLQEKQNAMNRSEKTFARLESIESDHVKRTSGAITEALERMWSRIASNIKPENAAVLSGATGIAAVTAEERTFLAGHPDLAVRATGSHLGHALEAQFPANIALAATAVQRGKLYPPCDSSGVEHPLQAPLRRVVVTSIGHRRGECLALLEAVG